MVSITFYRDKDGRYKRFVCEGHADYADYGSDIVCSAVSVLAIGTCNAVEKLTDDPISVQSDEERGLIDATFPEGLGHDGQLLVESMVLSAEYIYDSYSDFIEFNIEEV